MLYYLISPCGTLSINFQILSTNWTFSGAAATPPIRGEGGGSAKLVGAGQRRPGCTSTGEDFKYARLSLFYATFHILDPKYFSAWGGCWENEEKQ